jgi:site-specific DNA recombinase
MTEYVDWDEELGGDGPDVSCYIRVSTQKQAKEGFSVEFQMSALRKELEQRALKPRKVYWRIDAGKTGSTFANRKVVGIAEDFAKGKTSELLVWDIDRVGRDAPEVVEFFSSLVKKGGKIWTPKYVYSNDIISFIMLALNAWVAQMEYDKIRERCTKGIAKSFEKKNWNLHYTPFGYRLETFQN